MPVAAELLLHPSLQSPFSHLFIISLEIAEHTGV